MMQQMVDREVATDVEWQVINCVSCSPSLHLFLSLSSYSSRSTSFTCKARQSSYMKIYRFLFPPHLLVTTFKAPFILNQ